MATKITLMAGETPIAGATIIVGSLVGAAMITSIRGVVSFDLTTGWEGYVDVYMLVTGIPMTSTVHLIEGANHVIDILFVPETP